MNWPFVWRETYDAEHARAERLAKDNARLWNQNLTLNAEILTHEQREPVRLLEPEKVVTVTRRAATPIDRRIEEVSEGDGKLKRYFYGMVGRLRKEGKSDGDILGEIRWQTTETE